MKFGFALALVGLPIFSVRGGTDVYLLIGQSNMAGRGRLTETNRGDCRGSAPNNTVNRYSAAVCDG